MRACEACGRPLAAGVRSNARFCSDRCRKAAARTKADSSAPVLSDEDLLAEVYRLLDRVVDPGVRGAQAVDLAKRLQVIPATSPAAAALHRELRQLRTELEASPVREPDIIDVLKARRIARAREAGVNLTDDGRPTTPVGEVR